MVLLLVFAPGVVAAPEVATAAPASVILAVLAVVVVIEASVPVVVVARAVAVDLGVVEVQHHGLVRYVSLQVLILCSC